MSRNPDNPTTRGARWRRWIPAVVVALLMAGGLSLRAARRRVVRERPPTFAATRGPLAINLSASGTLQSQEQIVLRSEVEGRTTIVWLIEEGRTVKEGDLLVELDSSRLKDSLVEQEIRVLNAEAILIQARENLEVVRNQAAANIEEAELGLRFARLDSEKYEQGEYPQQLQQSEADITIAGEELQRVTDQLEWSRRLAAEGYITRTELQADELAVKRRQLDLELAQGRRRLLTEFTHRQTVERQQSNIKQAEMTLDRVRRKARADTIRAESEARAREQEYNQHVARLERIKDQIRKCRIVAPADGLALYATTVRPSRWGGNQPLAVGQDVSERTELIYLPITTAMKAEIRVPEASLTKLRVGLPAVVRVDALPGRLFPGRLARVGLLPDSQQMWMNPDLKLYTCEVHLLNGAADLRPGMSGQVEILIESYDDALFVPVQSVLQVDGRPTVYVLTRTGEAAPRPVEIGLDNNRMVRIISGLEAGEPVLLAPPLPPSARADGGEIAVRDFPAPAAPEPAPAPEAAPDDGAPRPDIPGGEGAPRPRLRPNEGGGGRRRPPAPEGAAP